MKKHLSFVILSFIFFNINAQEKVRNKCLNVFYSPVFTSATDYWTHFETKYGSQYGLGCSFIRKCLKIDIGYKSGNFKYGYKRSIGTANFSPTVLFIVPENKFVFTEHGVYAGVDFKIAGEINIIYSGIRLYVSDISGYREVNFSSESLEDVRYNYSRNNHIIYPEARLSYALKVKRFIYSAETFVNIAKPRFPDEKLITNEFYFSWFRYGLSFHFGYFL